MEETERELSSKQNLLLHLSIRKPSGDSVYCSAICISTHTMEGAEGPLQRRTGLCNHWVSHREDATGISEHLAVPSIWFGMKSARFPYGLKCIQGYFHLWTWLWLTEQATVHLSGFLLKGIRFFVPSAQVRILTFDGIVYLPKALIIFT